MKILNIIRLITENHYLIIALAFFVGIFYSQDIIFLSGYSTFILAVIFFLSSLKIDLGEVRKSLNNKKLVFGISFSTLILLPVAVYYVVGVFDKNIAIALLILSAMPVGMTAPLLTEIVRGRQSLSLVLTVVTSLLAPITAPFLIQYFAGTVVEVSFWEMFNLLAIVIYIPFVFAQVLKTKLQIQINKISKTFTSLSTILLGVLIAVIVARQAEMILGGWGNILHLVYLFIFFAILHIVGYFFASGQDRKNTLAVVVCFSYMNFTLAIELVNKFFTEPKIIIPVVLSIIPWAIIFIPFKRIAWK